VIGETEREILNTVKQKRKYHDELIQNMTAVMAEFSSISAKQTHRLDYNPQIEIRLPEWLKEFKTEKRII